MKLSRPELDEVMIALKVREIALQERIEKEEKAWQYGNTQMAADRLKWLCSAREKLKEEHTGL